MIKHKIPNKGITRHEQTVFIDKERFDRFNRLLSIDNLESMSDEELLEIGAEKDSARLVFNVKFDDGAELYWYLCSGNQNYYDDAIFYYAHNGNYYYDLDCCYKLDDISIETDTDIYIVRLVKM